MAGNGFYFDEEYQRLSFLHFDLITEGRMALQMDIVFC
jgi:hypothetical protein